MRRTTSLWAAALLALSVRAGDATREARVDAKGVLRWTDDGGEVALLGVNYYTPFTVDYAELRRLGFDHRQVIRDDVAHFRRLGLGCIRLHCFDREFSDADGNVLDNDHLALLDELISECASNNIYTVLTPIAWWGGHYAPGSTHGFSDRYEMRQMTTDRQAWAAQARFLKQFAEHVNRRTGRRYADDPAVLAFECINEPLYPKNTPDSRVTDYINTLSDALRASGTTKPIYYNSWGGRNAAAAAARIDGVTGSNYPTGLASGRALKGPQLLRARGSSLRPDADIACTSRMVYEFDAADVPGSHMYPAMAKFFRSESVQVAAQFQYDPLPLAPVNHNWMTHHLNLVCTPGKAISLAIAAEVFRSVPRGVTFGLLPEAAVFPPFRCSAEADLSEKVTDKDYLNSNTTATPPPEPEALMRVWGCGCSPVVSFDGAGAYFLDRAAPGVWRLQLYPDVFTVADPYSGTDAVKVRILPNSHPMTLRLPDLGDAFTVRPFAGQRAGERRATAKQGAFEVPPGDYLLTRTSGLPTAAALRLAAAAAPRYVAPEPDASGTPLLRADVPKQWRAGSPLVLRAEAVSATHVTARLVSAGGAARDLTLRAAAKERSPYQAEVPADALTPGLWHVTFRAAGAAGTTDYPDERSPDIDWFPTASPPVTLLRAPKSAAELQGLSVAKHGVESADVSLADGRTPDAHAIRLTVAGVGGESSAAGFTQPFVLPESPMDFAHPVRTGGSAGASPSPGAVSRAPGGRGSCRAGLRVVARGGAGGARIELGFRMRNGQGLGCDLTFGPGWSDTLVPLAKLHPLWGLPDADAFRWDEVQRISVLTGAWLLKESGIASQTVDVASVEWVRTEPAFPLSVAGEGVPWSLFDADAWLRVPIWSEPLRRGRATDDEGRDAVHLGADRFDGERESLSLRAACDGATFARLWGTDGEGAVLTVRARATCPHTTGFELAFIESGGVPWGTVVPLTPEWRTIRIPVGSLRLFTQWGKAYAEQAGPRLRLDRLEHVNVCFGKWLYPQAAAEPHAFEISAIGIEPGE